MHTPKWTYNGSNGANDGFWNAYGYAFQTAEKLIPGQLLRGVPGEAYGLLSDMYFSPDSLYGIVFITNGGGKFASESNGFYNIENAVINAVYSILLTPSKLTTTDETLNEGSGVGAPSDFGLSQNYPNPFNPTTTIQYAVPVSGEVALTVYDVLGGQVARLQHGFIHAGEHTAVFDGSDLSSGTYVYTIEAPGYMKSLTMTLLK
jgi:hypothetical protein